MFDRIEKLIGIDKLELIKSKTVLLIGLGGVGASCLESLIRSGISNIIIVDFDSVELSNINRQVIANVNTIGMKKTKASIDLIKSINPSCNVIDYDLFLDENNIKEIFDSNKIDYVIDAIDTIKTKKSIILECINRKIKFISSMGTGNKFDPTMLEITDIRKTVNDPIARILRGFVKEYKLNDKIMVVSSKENPVKVTGCVSSLSFVPNTCGILLASYVINDIIK